jgi:MFS transporter, DHA1 family, multidrug resistance protein
MILGALTAFAPLSIDMYLPAFPAIQDHFGATPGAVQATLAVFFIGFALAQGVYGPVADRYGRRGPLLFGIALYILASILASLAPDIESLIVARFVQAVGGCAGVVIARAMVRDLFEMHEAARIFSSLMLVLGVAPILAPLLGGQLLAVADWRAIFWALAGIGGLCLVAVLLTLEETLPPDRRSRGGLGDALRAYGHLLGNRRFMVFTLTGGVVMAGLFAYITGSPFVFIELHGVSPQTYGVLFGANAAGLIAASQVNIRLLRRFSSHAILSAAIRVNMVAGLVLALVGVLDIGGLPVLMAPLFVVIASLGLIAANATALAMGQAHEHAGAASALIGVIQFLLAAVIGALVGVLQNGTAIPMTAVIAVLGVAGFLLLRLSDI